MKSYGSIVEVLSKLVDLSVTEGNGITGVRVKSVEIEKNTNGEGNFLGHN